MERLIQDLFDKLYTYLSCEKYLSHDIQSFIETMIGHPTIEELDIILNDESDSICIPLQELIFYPTLPFQYDIEPILEKAQFTEVHEKLIIHSLINKQIVSKLIMQDDTKISIYIHHSIITQVIKRIHLNQILPPECMASIHSCCPNYLINPIKVCIRNQMVMWTTDKISFISKLIQGIHKFPNTLAAIQYFVKFIRDIQDETNCMDALRLEKKRLQLCLTRAQHAEDLMQKMNMELILSSGIRLPYANSDSIYESLEMIDRFFMI